VPSAVSDRQTFPRITALTLSTVSSVRAVHGRPLWIVNGRAAVFKSGIPLKCLGPTHYFLQILVAFCTFLSYQVSGRT
jgi:hypothetical protein